MMAHADQPFQAVYGTVFWPLRNFRVCLGYRNLPLLCGLGIHKQEIICLRDFIGYLVITHNPETNLTQKEKLSYSIYELNFLSLQHLLLSPW